jgi:hypothetical protein
MLLAPSHANMRSNVVFSCTEAESSDTVLAATVPVESVICQLCDKPGHSARYCYQLGDAEFMAEVTASAMDHKKTRGRRWGKGGTPKKAGAPHPTVLMADVIDLGPAERPTVQVLQCHEGKMSEIVVAHDDCADVSIIRDIELFEPGSLKPASSGYGGAVPGLVA